MSQQTIVISGYTKCFTNVNSVGILGVLPVLFTNLNYVVAGEVLWMNGGEITKGPYHQRCLCWNLLTRRILRRLPWPTTTIRTPFHSLLGTPKTALSRIPFPKTQSDSSIEDVSLKPTRQEAVKKEPKSNATWDYWPLKCTKDRHCQRRIGKCETWKWIYGQYVKIATQSEVAAVLFVTNTCSYAIFL